MSISTDASKISTDASKVTLAPNGKVFDLPAIVASEQGIFERHGLAVSWAANWDARPSAEREVFSRLKESLFEKGNAIDWMRSWDLIEGLGSPESLVGVK